MSTKRGNGPTRKRAQKYKNTFAFKNDLHDKTPQMKRINQINVCEVCEHCKAQIEWKIKYKKYKALSQAKTCIRCSQRTITKAYHVVCKECAKKEKICAKCLISATEVNIEPDGPTMSEQQQLKAEMDRLIKSLPERKRRTFLRYMKKGKEQETTEEQPSNDIENTEEINIEPKKITRVPHTREDLLNKIEMLKISNSDEDDNADDDSDFDTDFDVSDSSDDELSSKPKSNAINARRVKRKHRERKTMLRHNDSDSTDCSDLDDVEDNDDDDDDDCKYYSANESK